MSNKFHVMKSIMPNVSKNLNQQAFFIGDWLGKPYNHMSYG